MNPINLHVSFVDGTELDALASAPDYIAFESKFDKSVQAFATDTRLTYMVFLAWSFANRTGKTKLDFDAWVNTVADIEVSDPKA
jgi:hypothetical protein